MKKINYLLAVIVILIVSCKKDENKLDIDNDIIGLWKLTEYYADPGDGSGTWQEATSNKTLEFRKNGEIIVENGAFCFGTGQKDKDIATYEIKPSEGMQGDKVTNILNITAGCNPSTIMFEKGKLMIFYPCIEGCGEKFERIK